MRATAPSQVLGSSVAVPARPLALLVSVVLVMAPESLLTRAVLPPKKKYCRPLSENVQLSVFQSTAQSFW